jgi:hypothetical protein
LGFLTESNVNTLIALNIYRTEKISINEHEYTAHLTEDKNQQDCVIFITNNMGDTTQIIHHHSLVPELKKATIIELISKITDIIKNQK